MLGVVGTKLKYGVYLEKGADVPARVPRRKKYMVWGRPKTGKGPARGAKGRFVADPSQWVFAKRASGFRLHPRPYIYVTLKRNEKKLGLVVLKEARGYVTSGGVRIG